MIPAGEGWFTLLRSVVQGLIESGGAIDCGLMTTKGVLQPLRALEPLRRVRPDLRGPGRRGGYP